MNSAMVIGFFMDIMCGTSGLVSGVRVGATRHRVWCGMTFAFITGGWMFLVKDSHSLLCCEIQYSSHI